MNSIVSVLQLAVGLFTIWFLFACWREYKNDAFRQRLFALRDDLFDYAHSGKISFDDPAYRTLRNLTNVFIRFAHRLTFTRVIVLVTAHRSTENPMEIWTKDIERLPSDVQAKLKQTHDEIVKAVGAHVVLWSPIALVLTALLIAVGLLVKLFKVRVRLVDTRDKLSSVLEKEALEQPLALEECLAPS